MSTETNERRFVITIDITDIDPCNDERDIQAIKYVIYHEFDITYRINNIQVSEITAQGA